MSCERHREFLVVQTQFSLVERLAHAQRIVGRACDDEFRIDEQGHAVLVELVSRVREEAAFVSPPAQPSDASPEEPVPDFEGGP